MGQGLPEERGNGGFSLPTFIRPGDQPEVLCFLLEFLFADLLGLYQMKYACGGKHRASNSATLNFRLRGVWMHAALSPPEMQKGHGLHWMHWGPGLVWDLLPKPGGSLGADPGLAKDQEKSHLKTVTGCKIRTRQGQHHKAGERIRFYYSEKHLTKEEISSPPKP